MNDLAAAETAEPASLRANGFVMIDADRLAHIKRMLEGLGAK